MSEWLKVCTRAELPVEGTAREFAVRDKILCIAMIEGRPLALNNICPHRGGPLAEGTIECGKVVCPWHQWEFDLTTGEATGSSSIRAVCYELRLDGDDVMVEL